MGKGSGRVALVVIAWGGSEWGALRGAVLVALSGSDEHLAEGGAAASGGDGRIWEMLWTALPGWLKRHSDT